MAESINADEIDLLTKLCVLYEKITELLPYVVMEITQNNIEFALSDTLGDGISLNNFFDDNDIKDDVFSQDETAGSIKNTALKLGMDKSVLSVSLNSLVSEALLDVSVSSCSLERRFSSCSVLDISWFR